MKDKEVNQLQDIAIKTSNTVKRKEKQTKY